MKTHPLRPDRFAAVHAAAKDQIATLAPRLLPSGKHDGNRWVARTPWRDDKRASLHVYYNSAHWCDFGAGESGSIIDLVMKIDRCEVMTALGTLEGLLGLDPTAPARPKPKVARCPDCAHCWQQFDDEYVSGAAGRVCLAILFGPEEAPLATRLARRSGWGCRPNARLYREKATA